MSTNYRINYFSQIKSFYSIVFNSDFEIRPVHISLYLFLLNQNNRISWVEWFKCPYDLAMAGACINSKNTYYKTLDDLQSFNLIEYEKGINLFKAPKIKIIALDADSSVLKNNTLCVPLSEQLSVQLSEQLSVQLSEQLSVHIYKLITDNIETINNRQDEFLCLIKNFINPKSEDGEKQKLVFPYNSEKFMLLWNELVKMPKWRKKPFSALQLTLHKLSEFDEEFVIELIENAITGNYQGIIFSNTKEKYEQFKQQKYGGENIRNNAKKQGVSKQELASILHEHFQNRDNSDG